MTTSVYQHPIVVHTFHSSFQKTCSWFQSMHRVPNAHWDVHRHVKPVWLQYEWIWANPLQFVKYSTWSFPLRQTIVSEVFWCLCMGSGEPGSVAFNIRWLLSESESLRSRFILNLGLLLACSVKLSSIAWVIFILLLSPWASPLWNKQVAAKFPQSRKDLCYPRHLWDIIQSLP